MYPSGQKYLINCHTSHHICHILGQDTDTWTALDVIGQKLSKICQNTDSICLTAYKAIRDRALGDDSRALLGLRTAYRGFKVVWCE